MISKFSGAQKSTPFGGSLNLLPMTYKVSDKPQGDVDILGYLAYISEADRKNVMAVGHGEIQMHLDYIKSRVGQIRKLKAKRPGLVQMGFEL